MQFYILMNWFRKFVLAIVANAIIALVIFAFMDVVLIDIIGGVLFITGCFVVDYCLKQNGLKDNHDLFF